jgi:magnesium transporter
MIRSTLLLPNGTLIQDNVSLAAQWRDTPGSVFWIDLCNEEPKAEQQLLEDLGCHPLAVQDAQRIGHPPKIEPFENSIFILYRGLATIAPGLILEQIPIALFFGNDLLITRHKGTSVSIAEWWQKPALADYLKTPFLLATKIIHTSFARYLEAVLDFEHKLGEKEEAMQDSANDEDLRELTAYKARLRKLRRVFNYHERLAAGLLSLCKEDESKNAFIHEAQDLHDRADRLASLAFMYYEICGDLIEGYLSITSHQLNRTMQILTVVTTIFVPLGFLAGIYGMNFDNMPELRAEYGYYYLLSAMGIVVTGALILFKLKRWI